MMKVNVRSLHVCIPCAQLPNAPSSVVLDKCRKCKTAVWRTVKRQSTMPEGADVVCLQCSNEIIAADDVVIDLTERP